MQVKRSPSVPRFASRLFTFLLRRSVVCRVIVARKVTPFNHRVAPRVGISIGTACYRIHGETFDQIVTSADKAMYLTKSFHRKRADELRALKPEEIKGVESYVNAVSELPEELVEFATVKAVTKDGLILEVDETHIVSSSAIN